MTAGALLLALLESGLPALPVLPASGRLPAQASPPSVHSPRRVAPVLAFPDPSLDDTAAYQGYTTRLYRDSKGNTVQIYLDRRSGRVVTLWADAADESLGFTLRDAAGKGTWLGWASDSMEVADSAGIRTMEYQLIANAPRLTLGWFLLGTMRVERDFQYARLHLRPFTAPPFAVAEESMLVARLARLPADEQQRQLALLGASSVGALRARLQPTLVAITRGSQSTVRVARPSLDGRNRLLLEVRVDTTQAAADVVGRTISITGRAGGPVRFAVRVTTDARPLTPLPRDSIFNPAFLAFLAQARVAHDSARRGSGRTPHGADSATIVRYRRLEREVRSVELLSSEEKLMAGLPNFATYFGRDMLMTALMMRPIWSPAMSEHVIASVLRKLGPGGDVSHEEALGGQAIRENAADYSALVAQYLALRRSGRGARADSVLGRARDVLRDLQRTRENYHMEDDDFQLPVLVARYLTDLDLPADRKRAFLLRRSSGGATHLALLLRELALVAEETRPYVEDPRAAKLVSFVKRDSTHWRSASWRDSDAGYANGRFAMDINAIWAPQALEAIATIFAALPAIDIPRAMLDPVGRDFAGTPLPAYLADSGSLRQAIETWRGARRHFLVSLGPDQIARSTRAKLAWMPEAERRYWEQVLARESEASDSITFLALSLDAAGRPIPIINTDPATDLFLEGSSVAARSDTARPQEVLGELEPFLRRYPVGLFIEQIGPVVANDTYASRQVWERFRADAYHSPRVVWGREVNLLLLGLAHHIAAAFDGSGRLFDPALGPFVSTLSDALRTTLAAVRASGVEHNELWSYRIEGGRLRPIRYGTSSDVQLWSTTDLAVQFMLSRLPPD